jgi:hypothetical protein
VLSSTLVEGIVSALKLREPEIDTEVGVLVHLLSL